MKQTLGAAAARNAAQWRNRVAIHSEDRQITFDELHRESNRSAHARVAAGLRPGSRVAFLGK